MKLKKFLALLLTVCPMLSLLSACGSKGSEDTSYTTEETAEIMQKSDPAEDDTLNILMIGNSFCYYYTDELYGMLTAAGIKARVYNLYYSGCPLEKHWEWWKDDIAGYESLVCHDENGRTEENTVSLRYALEQQNWDIISLQASSGIFKENPAIMALNMTKTYRSDLLGYLKEQFPYTDHYWHQTWAYQVGYNRDNYAVANAQQQELFNSKVRDFAISTCEEYGLTRVNTGEAWQIVREDGYDNLCARLAINNGEGDYYHDGDIGGGQYLNACVWFEYLTGQSCLDNTYRPTEYELSEELMQTFREAAHKAVEDAIIE